jgi:hypothetical protein
MKTTAISLAVMMMSAMTFGQTHPHFQPADVQKSTSIYNYVREHINCPGENTACFIPGTEVIAFTVTSTGEVKDFKIVSSLSAQLDEEMIRALQATSGSWEPGRINGESADMKHEVAMAFIPSNFDPVQEATKYLSKGNSLIYKNPRRALRYINDAFRLFPCSESVLVARSVCKAELGDVLGAMEDCDRIIALNNSDELPGQLMVYGK